MSQDNLNVIKYGDYFLVKHLAVGRKVELWLACKYVDHEFQGFFVIKKTIENGTSGQTEYKKIIEEGKTGHFLMHQNIVTCYDYGFTEVKDRCSGYIAMDYVFGKNLAQVQRRQIAINEKSIPLEVTIQITGLIAQGLAHANTYCNPYTLEEEPVIHRDISPSNIMISYCGEIKILDFGIALRADHDHSPGKLAGKITYMSPEQVAGQKIDTRSDLYSLGIIFWELLSGCKLFDSETGRNKRTPAAHLEIVHPAEVNPDVPLDLGDICMKCLHPEPDDRYPSVADFYNTLRKWRNQTGSIEHINLKEYMLQLFLGNYTVELEFQERIRGAAPEEIVQISETGNFINNSIYCNKNYGQDASTEEYTTFTHMDKKEDVADKNETVFVQTDVTITDTF